MMLHRNSNPIGSISLNVFSKISGFCEQPVHCKIRLYTREPVHDMAKQHIITTAVPQQLGADTKKLETKAPLEQRYK